MHKVMVQPRHLWIGIVATALTLGAGGVLYAQGNSQQARVHGLNTALLRLQSQLPGAASTRAAQVRAEAAGVIAERQAALAALIEQDAQRALALAFPPGLLKKLASDFPQSASRLEEHGVWVGTLEAFVVDDETLTHGEEVRRLRMGQQALDLHFAGQAPAGLTGGHILRVSGVRAGNAVAAADGEVQGADAAAMSCSTTGNQRIAILKVTFPGVNPSYPNATLHDYFFGTSDRSVSGYWQDASYGAAWATGDVYPGGSDSWYVLDREYSCASNNDESTLLRNKAIEMADPDVNFNDYERIFIIFPRPSSGCRYAGLGSIGCWLSAPDGSPGISYAMQVTNSMGSRIAAVELSIHEGGHNLGLHHASSRDFGSEALGPLNANGTHSEYGDTFSTMGSWNLGHYAAPHKKTLGWLQNYQSVNSNGNFTVQPMSDIPTGTLQAIEVQRGTENNTKLWVEYRRPHGDYDSALSSHVYGGALIHYDDLATGGRTLLLDFTPETGSWSDPALLAGQTWEDPHSNLALTVGTAADSSLQVSVNYGSLPCVEANPTVSLSPGSQTVQAGQAASYSVTVTNNDSSGCDSGVFDLASALPAGWDTTFGDPSLTIAPGGTANTLLTKSPLTTPEVGSYSVDVSATHASASTGTFGSDAFATVNVTQPTFILSVSSSGGGSVNIVETGASCRNTCNYEFPQFPPAGLTLHADPDKRKSLQSWGGACAGVDPANDCQLVLDDNHSVSATFGKSNGGGGKGGGGKGVGKGKNK